jgi:hypothetical protein
MMLMITIKSFLLIIIIQLLLVVKDTSDLISQDSLSSFERYIISSITSLSNRFIAFETNIKNINQRLTMIESNVNKRLSNMENNINLIYERQALQSLLHLLNSFYLIECERLETRRFYSSESHSTLKFFRFVSKQFIKNYSVQWSLYTDISQRLSLKPKSIEVNLLGFGKLQKKSCEKKNISFIESPTSMRVDSTNCRSSYASYCYKNFDKFPTHVQARSQGGAHSARAPPLTKNRLEGVRLKNVVASRQHFFSLMCTPLRKFLATGLHMC